MQRNNIRFLSGTATYAFHHTQCVAVPASFPVLIPQLHCIVASSRIHTTSDNHCGGGAGNEAIAVLKSAQEQAARVRVCNFANLKPVRIIEL